MRRPMIAIALILVLGGCAQETDPSYIAQVNQWHAGRITRLKAEDGWLTLVGLHPLQEGANTVGSAGDRQVQLVEKAPAQLGVITVSSERILFAAHPGVPVTVAGAPEAEPVVSTTLQTDRSGRPTVLEAGSLRMHVIDRDGLLFLRVKDRQAETLLEFHGVMRFPVSDRWRVAARLEDGPATMAVPNVLGQTSQVPSPGVLVFKLAGKECRLTAQGEKGQGLFIVFGDGTNGKTTYGGGRFLSTEEAQPDGTYILDFNLATNPPCVFTPYATCPLPSLDNILPVAVAAGERMWGEQH
jgi:uncharacterized protein (DUF1684 family)